MPEVSGSATRLLLPAQMTQGGFGMALGAQFARY
jgi:hypothetical protein